MSVNLEARGDAMVGNRFYKGNARASGLHTKGNARNLNSKLC